MQAADGPNSSQLEWHQIGVETTRMRMHSWTRTLTRIIERMRWPCAALVAMILATGLLSHGVLLVWWQPMFGLGCEAQLHRGEVNVRLFDRTILFPWDLPVNDGCHLDWKSMPVDFNPRGWWRWHTEGALTTTTSLVHELPVWNLAVPFAAASVFGFVSLRRRGFVSGQCQRCGYALLASTRCPECGAEQQKHT